MGIRHAALSIGAVLVLGLGVYLFVEVRAQPVVTESSGSTAEPPRAAAPPPPPSVVPAVGSGAPALVPALAAGEPTAAPADLDAAMAEANRAYDRGDLDEAKTLASRLLARQPTSIRMLRILVSASCIDGDTATAVASFSKLPAPDQAQMRVRCARYGVAFPDKPDKP